MARPLATNRTNIGVDLGGPLRVFALRRPKPPGYTIVNTTSGAKTPLQRGLSPFNVGPIPLYGGRVATNLENAWQFAKVYRCHVDRATGTPSAAYWDWAEAGWADPKPRRFPMGRGAKPLFSWWDGKPLGYIEARKQIYAPLYAEAVRSTPSFKWLQGCFANGPVGLVDFDGWDHVGQGFSLREVIEAEKPKMGHAFVLAGLLTGDYFWIEDADSGADSDADSGTDSGTNIDPGPAVIPTGEAIPDGDPVWDELGL